jgi:cytochrome c oxidase cbb3-type subunit III
MTIEPTGEIIMEQNQQGHHDYDGIIEDREQKPPVYFTILFYSLIVWAVAFSAFYLLSGWSSEAEFQTKMSAYEEQYQTPKEEPAAALSPAEQPEEAATVAAKPESVPDGAAIYAQRCAMCHGGDAKGGIGPDLTAAEYAHGKTPEAISRSISAGIGGGMPAFGNQLKQEDIKALVDYLLSL